LAGGSASDFTITPGVSLPLADFNDRERTALLPLEKAFGITLSGGLDLPSTDSATGA
jgi:hypothetical protein